MLLFKACLIENCYIKINYYSQIGTTFELNFTVLSLTRMLYLHLHQVAFEYHFAIQTLVINIGLDSADC